MPVFVECPWDQCTELLDAGRTAAEAPADIVWSALPPSPGFGAIAYSQAYTHLHYVLARRTGDTRIRSLSDLEGRTLGIINDPSAYATLEAAGLRWAENLQAKGRRVATLGSLVPITDQGRIHDALAEGVVDAFAVDAPIMHWACTDADSPWRGRIEIVPGNIAPAPWYYTAAVADHPSACRLLMAADAFIAASPARPSVLAIERQWQGHPWPERAATATSRGVCAALRIWPPITRRRRARRRAFPPRPGAAPCETSPEAGLRGGREAPSA